MPNKPTFENLLALALGESTDAESARRAVADDADAARTLSLIETVIGTLRTDDTVAPPADVLRRAMAIMRPQAQTLGWLETLRRFVADLTFDSRVQPALTGFRSASAGAQLVYQSEIGEIELQVTPRPASEGPGWLVAGQLTPSADDLEIVAMSREGDILATTTPDEAGIFSFAVEGDSFELMIRANGQVIVIPQIELE